MTPEQRAEALRTWGDSRLPQRRAVFQALRKAALLFYYIVPGRTGGRNPAWDAIGYDGPLGQLPDAPPRPLRPTPIEGDTTLDCDVVIVGSGAGGGAAAGVLAEAGLDMIVIESGRYYDDRDFAGSEFQALTQYYMGAPTATHDHPHLFIPFAPWRGADEHFQLMEAISNTTPIGVLLLDRDGGEVRVGRDGEPVVRYALSDFDARHLRTGLDGAAELLEATGARRIFSSHAKWVAYEPGRSGSRSQFMSDADAAGYGPGQIVLNSFHIMGSARMGGSPRRSACDPTAQTWEIRNLYVLDGSSFPTASGVNPQISIQAIAHMSARELAAQLN